MSTNNMNEIETDLNKKIEEQLKLSDTILEQVGVRNGSRVEEEKSAFEFADKRNKLIVIGAFAVCALIAFLFYKAKFGMF